MNIMMMKKIIFSIVVLFLFAGCKKSLLDLYPLTSANKDDFYKTATDFQYAVTAIYGTLQTDGIANEFEFGDLPGDDTYAQSARTIQGDVDFDNLDLSPSSKASTSIIANRWNNCFIGISRANIVIDRIVSVSMDAGLKNQYLGEAKFLRAFFYFTLVKTFGDVPLIVKEIQSVSESYNYGRENKEKVYTQIRQDLQDAITLLPESYTGNNLGRVGGVAAKGLLARVLLYQGKFSEAAPILKSVVEAPGTYGLLTTGYGTIFPYNNGNNKEILFAIQYSNNAIGQQNAITNIYLSANSPTPDIYAAFEPGDSRRDLSIQGNPGTTGQVKKFLDPSLGQLGGTDYPILRYADILLMYAECLNEAGELSEAISFVNQIRTRAFGNILHNYQHTNSAAQATYVSDKIDLRNKILNERRLEFCFEGLRFWDLIRSNRLDILNAYFVASGIQVGGKIVEIKEYQKLFPIPQSIIDVNPSKYSQNTGY